MIFRTFRKADGTTVTRMYKNPYLDRDRKAKRIPSAKEAAHRDLFKQVSQAVSASIQAGDKRPRRVIFKQLYAQHRALLRHDCRS